MHLITGKYGMIAFSCPPQLILTGSDTSTCMGNGEWEPDPKQTSCESKSADLPIIIIVVVVLIIVYL